MPNNFAGGLMQCRWCDNANGIEKVCQRCRANRCRVPRWPLQLNDCSLIAESGYSSVFNFGGGSGGTNGCCARYISEDLRFQYTSPMQCGIDGFMRWSLTEQYLTKGVPFTLGGAYDRENVRRLNAFASYSAKCGWAYYYFVQDATLTISRQRYYGVCMYFLDLSIRGSHRFVRTQIGSLCGSQTYTNFLSCLQGTDVAGCTEMAPWQSDDCTIFGASLGLSVHTFPFTLTFSAMATSLNNPIVFNSPYVIRPQCGFTLAATSRATYLGHDFRPESGPVPINPGACDLTPPSGGSPPAVFCGSTSSPGACSPASTLGPVPGGLCAFAAANPSNVIFETYTELFSRASETRPGIGSTSPTLPDFSSWTLQL
jgi:hypothetical protein